jgi:hypothetical protein
MLDFLIEKQEINRMFTIHDVFSLDYWLLDIIAAKYTRIHIFKEKNHV